MSWLDPIGGGGGMVQDSPEWHAWRKKHIGASDVPAIMRTCDFRKPIDVFNAKVFGEKFEGNYATQRGKALEPVILAKFEETTGCRLTSPSLEYPHWKILSASLDGFPQSRNFVVECKAPSRIKHILALCGGVPETYKDQVQTQLLVAEVDLGYYVSYLDTEPDGFDLAIVEVRADESRQLQILNTCQRFWEIIQNGNWDENF